MSNKLVVRSTDIDDEFAEVYSNADAGVQGRSDNSANSNDSREKTSAKESAEDAFLAFEKLAREQEKSSVDRKTLSGFDQVEHDVTRAVKLGWEFLTRPL